MKKILVIIIGLMAVMAVRAGEPQKDKKFSRENFMSELKQFIAKEACLTPQESAEFFPLFNEMYKKQRVVFDQMKRIDRQKPNTEDGCKEAIKNKDKYDLELKKIQQTYHNKFLGILPACKVYNVIKAEDKFHRRMLKKWSKKPAPKKD